MLSAEAVGLMSFGGLMALAGVWLMLLEGETGSAKLALFGVEVQAVPAGFAVFLAGSVTTIAPIVEPEGTSQLVSGALSATGLTQMPVETVQVEIPPEASRRDFEPSNNGMAAAGLIRLGEMVTGTHSGSDWDWYLLGTESLTDGRFQVVVREGDRACDVFYFDWRRQFAGGSKLSPGSVGIEIPVGDNPGYFVQFACPEGTDERTYVVTFEAVPEKRRQALP